MADNDNNNKQQSVPYRRERTPSIVVQSLGLTFNQDSRLINESVDEPTTDDVSPTNQNDEQQQLDQDDQDEESTASSNGATGNQDQQSALIHQLHHQQQQQHSTMIRQSTIAGCTKSPTKAKTQATALINQNNSRRLSLNITNTRRQSLTVDGIGAFSTQGQLGGATSGNATGSLRNKVALKPGHSLMGWIRLASTSKDLSGTNGKLLDVTPEQLAQHNTPDDCWVALKSNVYNVTLYLSYHPGGEEELMRAAGQDATDLFNEVHRWVNYESILAKCLVGRYKCDPIATTSPINNKHANKDSRNKNKDPTIAHQVPPRRQSIALTVQSPTKYQSLLLNNSLSASSNQIQQPPTYVISQDKSSIKIKIQELTLALVRSRNLICDLIDQTELQISVILTHDWLYRVHLKLDQKVSGNIEAQLLSDDGYIVLNLSKKESVIWPKIGSSLDLNDSLCEMSLAGKCVSVCPPI